MNVDRGTIERAGSEASGPFSVPPKVALIFVDGLGLGSDDSERNPVLSYGGDLLHPCRTSAVVRPLDACLGVEGLPQSATGQTTLFTGRNAASHVGHHVTGFPTKALRELLLEHSFLKRLVEAGFEAGFVNAFRPLFFDWTREQQERTSATTLAHLATGRRFLDLDDVRAGRAVYQDITNGHLNELGFEAPPQTPSEAGRILARCIAERDVTLFEYFRTDRAGHVQDRELCEQELQRVDGLVSGCLDELKELGIEQQTLVLLTSDHGNIEDLSVKTHTRNAVPLMVWGEGTDLFTQCRSIGDVVPALLDIYRMFPASEDPA